MGVTSRTLGTLVSWKSSTCDGNSRGIKKGDPVSKRTTRKISDSDRLEWVLANTNLFGKFGWYGEFQLSSGRLVVTRAYDNPRDAIDEAITMGLSFKNARDYTFLHFEKGRYVNEEGRRISGPRNDGRIDTTTGEVVLPCQGGK